MSKGPIPVEVIVYFAYHKNCSSDSNTLDLRRVIPKDKLWQVVSGWINTPNYLPSPHSIWYDQDGQSIYLIKDNVEQDWKDKVRSKL